MQKLAERTIALALLVIAAALCLIAWHATQRDRLPPTGTTYQAVALMNGQLFFGRLDGGGAAGAGSYLVLRDVFYVQTRQNPDTKAVANVLVKRGGEAHGPDRMVINRQQVLLIEPVRAESQIGQLIAQQSAQQNTPQSAAH
jgi:hypothetical protein